MIADPSQRSLLIQMLYNGQLISTGTGFVIYGRSGIPYLVTNRHNVTGRDQNTGSCLSRKGAIPNEIAIKYLLESDKPLWDWRVESLYLEEKPNWIEHPSLGAKADFVAIKLTNLTKVSLLSYDIFDSGTEIYLEPSDYISVIGFPFGLTAGESFAIWATGFLATDQEVDFDELPIQLIDCRTRQGQSGSPVIAYRSGGAVPTARGSVTIFDNPVYRFLGIYSGRINKESDLGFVWKRTAIAQLADVI